MRGSRERQTAPEGLHHRRESEFRAFRGGAIGIAGIPTGTRVFAPGSPAGPIGAEVGASSPASRCDAPASRLRVRSGSVPLVPMPRAGTSETSGQAWNAHANDSVSRGPRSLYTHQPNTYAGDGP